MPHPKVPQEISNPINDNIKKLASLFPSAVKDGELDLEALKQELGQFTEVETEKYELTWAGKQQAKQTAFTPILGRTLKYIPEESKNPDTTQNLYIEGDNLEVLKLLRQNYYGAVKMIYIDPPYNTGNDFIYNDNFRMTKEESDIAEGDVSDLGERYTVNRKDHNRYHTNWLNMMYPRLRVAKDLLRDDGVIFISIGQSEISNLINSCDEIFNEDNKIAIAGRLMKSGGNKGKFFSSNLEYLLVYAKNIQIAQGFRDEMNVELIKKVYTQVETIGEKEGEKYRAMGLFQSSLDSMRGCVNQRYYIEAPDGTLLIPPGNVFPYDKKEGAKIKPVSGKDGVWRWTYDKYIEEKKKGNVEFKKTNNNVLVSINGEPSEWNVNTKIWLKDRQQAGQLPVDFISQHENRHSAKDLKILDIDFDFAKPTQFIKYLTKIIGRVSSDIILDFFSGSATTAHAVMQLNAEDNGNRKYIMVQLPETCDETSEAFKAGYKNICEIGKERIRRAGEKILEENKEKEGIENLDVGFKVFRVGDTNINWLHQDLKGADIFDHYQKNASDKDKLDFTPQFTDLDVVYEIMLRQADIPLSCNVEKLSAIGGRTYIFADSFVVCLEQEITKELVDKLAAIEPLPIKFIFRDSAFDDDISLKDWTFRMLSALIDRNSGGEKQTYTVEFI